MTGNPSSDSDDGRTRAKRARPVRLIDEKPLTTRDTAQQVMVEGGSILPTSGFYG